MTTTEHLDPLDVLTISPVIPVVVLDTPDQAVPLARALLRGGIRTVEITLRSEAALEGLERIANDVPQIVAGAGTVLTAQQARRAREAGASYLVTPGCTAQLWEGLQATGLPSLIGIGTVSEAMRAAELGARALKFFPAEASGGVSYLKALASPLPDLRFCPTGGVSAENASQYLSLPNVDCVGGTWVTPPQALATGDWDRVAELASAASELG